MKQITATIGKDKYTTNIKTYTEHTLISDEPEDIGGKNIGPSPGELLAASLGSCTCITLRMYADRKEWSVESIEAHVSYERDPAENTSILKIELKVTGDLTEEQRERLLAIAKKCPIHLTLTNPITIGTALVS